MLLLILNEISKYILVFIFIFIINMLHNSDGL